MKLLDKREKHRPGMREIFTDKFIQSTIEEFIHSDGQYMIMTKIPIKKTALHHERKKKNVEESEPNSLEQTEQKDNEFSEYDKTVVSMMEGSRTIQKSVSGTIQSKNNNHTMYKHELEETPLQKMQRKKLEAQKSKEEKMKEAARESLATRDQAKMRKNLELHGSMIADSNLSVTKSRDFIGDTLKSEFFNETGLKNPSVVSNISAFEVKPRPNTTIKVHITLSCNHIIIFLLCIKPTRNMLDETGQSLSLSITGVYFL